MKTDVHLQHDVIAELDWDPCVDAAQVGVIAKEGVVTLTGHVPAYAEKHAAEEVTKRVHGVRGVANEIEVRPGQPSLYDDEEIASAAVHGLQWDARVPHQNIQVLVERGWVTLDGTVEHQFEKKAADRVLHHLAGIRGITNAIHVLPQKELDEVKSSIEAAFRRSATLDSSLLNVETEGETVILTGDVHSHIELEEAERTAWAAGGVHQVQNCLTITPWGLGPAEEWGY